ncbi:unnamed protein product [Mycena citricolor]|uniref:Uncharacterized protein n=1 Tax=Mycena citricolor TaxID=2018698 RepID=A0AAD2Q3N4_9AGAR|nr:unnamed protein product [Mycena citricolor]CAK5272558.1 unnamed protein product [Mycena citricolor]
MSAFFLDRTFPSVDWWIRRLASGFISCPWLDRSSSTPSPPIPCPSVIDHPGPLMSDTRRLIEAAAALSQLLRAQDIPHAFHGTVLIAALTNSPVCDEIYCIVEGGQNQPHAFRRVRSALAGYGDFAVSLSPWTNRLHVSYRRFIPSIDVRLSSSCRLPSSTDGGAHDQIEILPAGETGPRTLDATTTMKLQGLPFLTLSEFIRCKLKAWLIRGEDRDAQDLAYSFSRYWNRIDVNRIPEQDMSFFVAKNPAVGPAWAALRRKYGM